MCVRPLWLMQLMVTACGPCALGPRQPGGQRPGMWAPGLWCPSTQQATCGPSGERMRKDCSGTAGDGTTRRRCSPRRSDRPQADHQQAKARSAIRRRTAGSKEDLNSRRSTGTIGTGARQKASNHSRPPRSGCVRDSDALISAPGLISNGP